MFTKHFHVCQITVVWSILQAEHGPDSQVVLVIAGDGVDLAATEAEVSKQCDALPRGDFASKALGHSFTVFARDMAEVIIRSCHSFLYRLHLVHRCSSFAMQKNYRFVALVLRCLLLKGVRYQYASQKFEVAN